MSTIYIGERQSGKTTMLIEMSEKTSAPATVAGVTGRSRISPSAWSSLSRPMRTRKSG